MPVDEAGMVAAIGQVVVSAAVYDWHIAIFLAVVEGKDEDRARELVSKPGAAMQRLRQLGAADPSLQYLYLGAKVVRGDRHKVVHSISMVGGDESGQRYHVLWSPGGSTEHHIKVEDVLGLARDIRRYDRHLQQVIARRLTTQGHKADHWWSPYLLLEDSRSYANEYSDFDADEDLYFDADELPAT